MLAVQGLGRQERLLEPLCQTCAEDFGYGQVLLALDHPCPRLGCIFLAEDGWTLPGALGVLDHVSKYFHNFLEKKKNMELNLLQIMGRQCRRDMTTLTEAATGLYKFPKEWVLLQPQ